MNFGVSGYNARQQLAVLRSVALGFAPDVVVLMPCNNDDEPELFVAASGHLVAQAGAEVVAPLVRPLAGRSALVTAASRAAKRLAARAAAAPVPAAPAPRRAEVSHEEAVPAALDAAVGAPLRAMIDSARRAGATVVVASFAGPLEWRRLFQHTARDEQVPLVELLELFPEARDWAELVQRFGLGWDPHLGPEAHRRWAHALAALFPDGLRPPRVPSDAPSDGCCPSFSTSRTARALDDYRGDRVGLTPGRPETWRKCNISPNCRRPPLGEPRFFYTFRGNGPCS